MCFDPVTLGVLSFAVGAAQAVAGYVGQQQQAKATEQAATDAYNIEQQQISRRQMQEADAANQKMRAQNIEEAQKVSEVEVSGAAANIAGVSLGNLVGDVQRRSADNRQTMRDNLTSVVQQLQMDKKAARSRAQSRINSSPRPSPLSLVAGLGGAALSGYNAYSKQMA